MASTQGYLDFVLQQLSALKEVTCRPMMGEFLLYYRGKLIGGVYDDRLLLKPAAAVTRLLPAAPQESPYPGAKPMILVEEVDRPELLAELLSAMYPELPAPTPKKRAAP